jgi:ATP-dependent Clp protease ATP-binding subunit ClpC
MFERFTDRARRVVVLAQEEARRLSHNYIGTEHILLGLLSEGEGVAAKALEELGIGLDAIRQQVVEIIGRGAQIPGGHIPFTPRAKKVLELSLRESLQLGHEYIGTEHILLGLIREGEGVAAQVLTRLGVTKDRLQAQVMELLRGLPASERMPGGEPVSRSTARVGSRAQLDEIMQRLDTISERLSTIERRLGLGEERAGREGAGPEDTGSGDAGTGAAGPGDAGQGDAGQGDAGQGDAGQEDSGTGG